MNQIPEDPQDFIPTLFKHTGVLYTWVHNRLLAIKMNYTYNFVKLIFILFTHTYLPL